MMINNKLKVENLKFKYGKKEILKGLSFEIENGIIAILGPNGAGKTTLMKVLVSLLDGYEGKICLNDINYLDKYVIKGSIGYLPQKFDTFKNVTGREFLEFIYDLKGLKTGKNEEVGKVIEFVDFEEFIDKKIKTYSGGVLRRLGIAQAFLGDSKIIIIDEPTVGLDPEQRIVFRNILSKISEEKIVIISTHIVEDIEFCSNNLFIMNKGILEYRGNARELIAKYKEFVWTDKISKDEFNKINREKKVLNFKIDDGIYLAKYISKERVSVNAKNEEISLEDAYICFLKDENKTC
ncbi:MAG: ATP-binding cassette domain-containing protein [Clostridium sp.]|uniref:ATP-binding cassette domain-containing protein n=1 Tax=Clostridium sp. TaxID=1506 RepID=UPI003F3B1387